MHVMAGQDSSVELSIRLFGTLELRAGDHKSAVPAGSKNGLLLAYLSFHLSKEGHPSAGINTDELAAVIWPDLNREERLNNFRVNFHHLKSDLARDLGLNRDAVNALFLRGRLTIRMNPSLVVTDVMEFTEAREEAERVENAKDRHRLLDRADRLYQEGFLPDFSDDWSRRQRRILAEQHINVMEQLVSLRSELDDPAGAEEARIRLGRRRTEVQKEAQAEDRPQEAAGLGRLFGYGKGQIASLHRRLHGDDSERWANPAQLMPPRALFLTGPDGVGKTRLAQEVAATFRDWSGYQEHHVSLTGLADPDDILEAVVRGLALPRRITSDSQLLGDYLKRRRVVLLLDDLDPRAGLSLLSYLLEEIEMNPGARLALLVTSVKPLRLPETLHGQISHHWVRPFPIPQTSGERMVKRLQKVASVQMFAFYARETDSTFQLTSLNAPSVADLCRLTAGVPGAIKIVATRIRQFPLEDLKTSLSGYGAPHGRECRSPDAAGDAIDEIVKQAIETAHAFGFSLLRPQVQRLFRRMTVFRGGCTAAAARVICDEPRAQECLETLVRYQLVYRRETAAGVRYDLTGVAMSFAGKMNEDAAHGGDAQRQTEKRHDDFFLQLAEEARRSSRGPDQSKELDRLTSERDNLDAVLRRCLPQGVLLDRGDAARGLRLAVSLWEFWNQKGLWRYGRTWLERAVRQTKGFGPPDDLAIAFNALAVIAAEQGDLDKARTWAETSVEIAAELIASSAESKTIGRRAEALNTCGYVVRRQAEKAQRERDFVGATRHLAAAQAFYERAAEDYGAAWGRLSVFWPWNGLGHLALLEYELLQQQATGEQDASGMVSPDRHDARRRALDKASYWLELCFTVALKTSDQGSVAQAARSLADVTFEQGQHGAHGKYGVAWVYLSKCLALWQEIGDWGCMAVCAERLAKLAVVEEDWNKAMRLCGMAWAMRSRVGIVDAFDDPPDEDEYYHGMKASLGKVIALTGAPSASSLSDEDSRTIFRGGCSAIVRDGSSAGFVAKLALNAQVW